MMHQAERLFGRDVSNLPEHPQLNKQPQLFRPNGRSLSLYQPHPHGKNRQGSLANVSTRQDKSCTHKEEADSKSDLRNSLTDYFDEAMGFMLSQEITNLPLSNYMPRQTEVTESMRTILLDWLTDVHLKFRMFPQTLFIVAAILDRYLAKKTVRKADLQLIGAASLFIAAKY